MKFDSLDEAYRSLANSALTQSDATVFVGGVTLSIAVRDDDDANADPAGTSSDDMLEAHRAGMFRFVGFRVSVSAGSADGASASLWSIEDRAYAAGVTSAMLRDYYADMIGNLAREAARDVIAAGRGVAEVFPNV